MQIEVPEQITPAELDQYLEQGWFRMNQTIFTTNIEFLKDTFHLVIWLRVRLNDFREDKKYKELSRKNKVFSVQFLPAIVSNEHEKLFSIYKNSKSFQASDSLQSLLYHDKTTDIYNTWMVNIFDGSRLIGVGYFDIGERSAAGITSFYHPDYSNNSLGLFMIYEKMFYCKNIGFQYFYPGYYAPNYAAFDYKLKIGKSSLEFYHPSHKAWFPFYG